MSSADALIHQTLHGYQRGHRLLGGSTALSREDRRLMLIMSDNPDANILRDERSLLLGYPLPSGTFYVLAKTWPAPEVDRPGCVWTHSLLLDERSLRSPDACRFLSLFQKPQTISNVERYEDTVRAPAEKRMEAKIPAVAPTALWTLYQPPNQPVDLRRDALEGIDSQEFLLTVWSQQWPELRRVFSFAEAPRVGRRIDGKLLDLQVTERPQKGSWDPEAGPAPPRTVVKPISDGVPAWCDALTQDLCRLGSLRDFIWAWGPVVPASRSSLWALASLYALLEVGTENQGVAEPVLHVLDRAFPAPAEGIELKKALFSQDNGLSPPGTSFERDLLEELAISGVPSSLLGIDLDLSRRARHLLATDAPAALELVEAAPARPTDVQRQIIDGVAAGLGEGQIAAWLEEDPEALAKLVNRSAALAAQPALWESADAERFWPLVRNPRASRERRYAMLHGMLAAHSQQFVRAVFDSWADAPEIYLQLLASDGATWRSRDFLASLDRKVVVSWLKENGPAPQVVSLLLESWKHKQLADLPAEEWAALWDLGSDLDDRSLALYFIAASDPETKLGAKRAVEAFQALLARKPLKKKALAALGAAAGDSSSADPRRTAANLLSVGFQVGHWRPIELLSLDDPKALESVLLADGTGEIVSRLVGELGDTSLPYETSEVIFKAAMQTEDHNALHKIIEAGRKFIPWL